MKNIKLRYLLLFVISLFIILSSLLWLFRTQLDLYKESEKKLISTLYKSVISEYNTHADILFFNRINKEEVLSIYKNTNNNPVQTRKDLYNELIDMYTNMKMFQLKQLHFHLPNNDSFLRFHRPKKYGDNLTNIRETVKYVNENHKAISGFEEGRIFNGYRFVYPLKYNGVHLGSVETSVSMKAFIDTMSKLLSANIEFYLEKSMVEKKVFNNELSNYEESKAFKGHVKEKSISKNTNKIVEDIISNSKNISKHEENIKNGEIVSFIESFNNNSYIVTIFPIKQAISNNNIANFIIVKKHDGIKNLFQKKMAVVIFIIFLVALMVYFLYKMQVRKNIIKQLAITDGLTKIYNRMYFDATVTDQINRAKRDNTYISFLMLDIDFFKQYNDIYGHQAGDGVLIKVAQVLNSLSSRANDYCFRLGGEEFGVLFIGLDEKKSLLFADKFKDEIENLKISHSGSITSQYVTASFGLVVQKAEDIKDVKNLYKDADLLLYRSKENGRNQVSI